MRICKRCGDPLTKFGWGKVCLPCRQGRGRMYDVQPPPRRGPEIPSGVERDRKKH